MNDAHDNAHDDKAILAKIRRGPLNLPLRMDGDVIEDAKGEAIAVVVERYCRDARFIVRACNAHEDLLAALLGELGPFRSDRNERKCGACSRCRSRAAIAKAEGL